MISALFSDFVIRISFGLRHLDFVISSSVYELRACFRPDHGTAPSSRLAFPSCRGQTSRRVISIFRRCHRNLPLQTQRLFHHATVSMPDDNHLRLSPAQDRTRPNRLPWPWSSASARGFPDKTCARGPYRKRRWRQMRLLCLRTCVFFALSVQFVYDHFVAVRIVHHCHAATRRLQGL